MKIDVKAFAMACAILWGVSIFLLTWWIILFDGPSADVIFISRLYRGYSITPVGSLVGFLWAFVDGAIGGGILAWLYNRLALRTPSRHA